MFVRIVTCEYRYCNACVLLGDLCGIGLSGGLFRCIYGKKDLVCDGVFGEEFLDLLRFGRINSHISLSLTELAISISHEKVYREFLCSCEEYAIVFEDDCSLEAHMLKNLQVIVKKIVSNPFEFGIIHLWNCNAGNTLKHAEVSPHYFKLYNNNGKIAKVFLKKEKRPYCPGTQAYIITRKCAKRLLELNEKIRMPIDNLIGDALYRTREFDLYTFDVKNMIVNNPMYENSTQSPSDLYICDDKEITSQIKKYGFR